MERNRQSLKSLKASLSMEKYNSQLRDKDQYVGTVMYVPATGRNASVRIEWQKPQHEILAVKDGKYILFRPVSTCLHGQFFIAAKSARWHHGHDVHVQAAVGSEVSAGSGCSRRHLWGGVSTIHLTLVPKGNASYKYAEIWVDSSGMPVQTKMVEKNGDATTMRLSDMERNLRISSDEFSLKLDSSVKIIKG